MINRVALFIDGGYLDKVLKGLKIDYSQLSQYMANGIPLLRTYYYHCLPYKPSNPSAEESKNFANAEKFFSVLNRSDNFTVREGKIAFRGKDNQGKPMYEQKRVDVYLATDLVMHSTKRLITHAALLTGDSDFLPAIEIAKSEGVLITLFYSEEKGSRAHDELLDAVDVRKKIDKQLLETWRQPLPLRTNLAYSFLNLKN
jgi:uncharacterized LabA/DUF88 family protein